jgi:hypothetical protein
MGDTPTMILTFSNGQSISVCGYIDKEMQGNIISEFNVFDCNSGKVISEYDAMQICRIIPKKDTLIIHELKYLPTGKNWKWNLIQLGEEIITIKDKKIISTGIKPKLEKFSINENEANFYLNSLTKGKGHNKEWELEIGKLEVLTLLGYKKAKIILENSITIECMKKYGWRNVRGGDYCTLDEEKLAVIFKEHKIIITVEEGVINGGLGSSINNFAIKNNLKNKIINRGVSDVFIEHGTVKQLLELTELDTKSLSKFLTKIYYD